MRSTSLTVSAQALTHNARLIRSYLPENVRLMAVVKADAYGHGLAYAARAFLEGGACMLAVAIVEEAAALREAGFTCPILILGGAEESSLDEAVRVGAAQAVFTPGMLRAMERAAVKYGKTARAHLKIDTGMSRIGVKGDAALEQLLGVWRECPHVEMEGMFTHFCVSETDPEFTDLQDSRFMAAVRRVRAAGYSPIAHAAATGAFENPRYMHDMVRPGLAMYGFGAKMQGLMPAQRLSARPVRLEMIAQGETVSYGRIFRAERDTLVMTIPIGYGDGYPRKLSGKAQAIVEGRRVPQIGRVCMDMTMFDVPDVPGVSLESEVVLMGGQGGERITPEELADMADTIPYEIMLGFKSRIRRIYE